MRSNSRRKRVSINGAVVLERFETLVSDDGTLNGASSFALYDRVLVADADAACIGMICDNEHDDRSKVVQEYARDARINLLSSPYALNLNLIE